MGEMIVNIVVDNRVRIQDACKLHRDVVRVLLAEFEHTNPTWAKKKRLGLPVWSEPKTITTWSNREDPNELHFPRGGLTQVMTVLRKFGHDIEVHDARRFGVEIGNVTFLRTLYDYQENLVREAMEREQCIVRAPTGSGKTTALLAIASRVRVPTLVVVHSQALLNQWKDRAVSELGLRPSQVGIVQGKKINLQPLTLTIQKSMANIAAKHEEVRDYFGCVIADEVHLFAASTFFECIDPFPARYRIGASADHRRKDQKEFLVHDLFGDVAADISRRDLVASGHVLDVEICVIPTDFDAPWYGVPEGKEDERRLDFVRLVKEMGADEDRNREIIQCVSQEVAKGEQVLVMAHEREHCMRLGQACVRAGMNAGYLLGGPESSKEFASTLEGLKSGRMQVGVGTYKAIGTGIDLPQVGVAVATTPISSNKQLFGQVRGRVCRTAEGKKGARLYVLWDRYVYARHLRNLVSWNPSVIVRDEEQRWVGGKAYLKKRA